jgi:putative spermidine/putrescine transport system permease protein
MRRCWTSRCRTGGTDVRITPKWSLLLLGPPIAFLLAFFVVPFLIVVLSSLHDKRGVWTIANYTRALGDLYYWKTLLLTFKLSLWVTAVSLAIGYPLAYYMTNVLKNRMLRRLFYIVVVTPLFTSNIVRAFGWMVLLGRVGLINEVLLRLGLVERPLPLLFSQTSIVIGLSYIMTPFMVLTIASVLQNIDRSLEDAAMDLGASRFATFLRITLPLSLPGVIAGSLIVFTLSVSAYVTPSILSGGKEIVTSMLIFQQYASVFDFNFGATLAVVLLVTTIVLVLGYLLVIERRPRVLRRPVTERAPTIVAEAVP